MDSTNEYPSEGLGEMGIIIESGAVQLITSDIGRIFELATQTQEYSIYERQGKDAWPYLFSDGMEMKLRCSVMMKAVVGSASATPRGSLPTQPVDCEVTECCLPYSIHGLLCGFTFLFQSHVLCCVRPWFALHLLACSI